MVNDGLIDRRGHHKTDDEVDELERLRRENLTIKASAGRKGYADRTVKKSERIRKDVRLGKLRHESKYYGNQKYLYDKEELEH
ncbi:MAG: hypothetical protein ACLUVM_13735 [Blautia faecis]